MERIIKNEKNRNACLKAFNLTKTKNEINVPVFQTFEIQNL